MSVSLVVLLVGAYPFVVSSALGEPFEYTNLPFPLCAPDKVYLHDTDCDKLTAGARFLPGQAVPMLIGRCFHDPFSHSDTAVYTIHRRLVSDQNGLQIQMSDTFSSVDKGCTTDRRVEHAVPPETPPGNYHFEGFSEIRAYRQMNVVWRSQSFEVQ